MTIHSEHPFLEPEDDRDPVRRLRGRLGGAVVLFTTGSRHRAGLTVSSVMVGHGEPAHVLALLDEDADFTDAVRREGRAVVHLLQWEHRDLAEAFAGQAPAPGGVFTLGTWRQTEWGPLLDGVPTWAGVRLLHEQDDTGWSLLFNFAVEHVEVGDDPAPLLHRRGRYLRP
ncbi:MAG: flavin reductase family protein [Nocardioidaceae bacterium]